jgi:hypothetical protein
MGKDNVCGVCGEELLDDDFVEETDEVGPCHEECCEFLEQEHEV